MEMKFRNRKASINRTALFLAFWLLSLTLSGCAEYRQKDVFSLLADYRNAGGGNYETVDMLMRENEYIVFPKTVDNVDHTEILLRIRTDEFDIPREAQLLIPQDAKAPPETVDKALSALLRSFCEAEKEEADTMLRTLFSTPFSDGENRSVNAGTFTLTESINELYRVVTVKEKF